MLLFAAGWRGVRVWEGVVDVDGGGEWVGSRECVWEVSEGRMGLSGGEVVDDGAILAGYRLEIAFA